MSFIYTFESATERILEWDTLDDYEKENIFIFLADVFGNDMPELLCLYRDKYQYGLKEPVYYFFVKWSEENIPQAKKFIQAYNPANIGTYKDLIVWYERCSSAIQGTIVEVIQAQIDEDLKMIALGKRPSLLGKWLPSINTSSPETRATARRLCKDLYMKPVQYRKLCTELRKALDLPETLFSSGQITEKSVENCLKHISRQAKLRFRRKFQDELNIANIDINTYKLNRTPNILNNNNVDEMNLFIKLNNPQYIHLKK